MAANSGNVVVIHQASDHDSEHHSQADNYCSRVDNFDARNSMKEQGMDLEETDLKDE